MSGTTVLQIFLLINVFLMGVLATFGYRHAMAHFRPEKHAGNSGAAKPRESPLPPEMKEKLLKDAQTHYQKMVEQSVADLQNGLKSTSDELTQEFKTLGGKVVHDAVDQYKNNVSQLQEQAVATVATATNEVNEQSSALKAKLQEDIQAEKTRLLQQIDTKLADAVTSFLLETLQHNVDLGAQSNYLIDMLEEHKDELAKGIANEA